jgi:hypothetical protein
VTPLWDSEGSEVARPALADAPQLATARTVPDSVELSPLALLGLTRSEYLPGREISSDISLKSLESIESWYD